MSYFMGKSKKVSCPNSPYSVSKMSKFHVLVVTIVFLIKQGHFNIKSSILLLDIILTTRTQNMLPSKAKEIFNKEKNEFFSDVANTLIENYIIKSNLVALKVLFYLSKGNIKSIGKKNYILLKLILL